MDHGRPRAADLRFGIALLLLFLGGGILAAYRLDAQSLWLDETYTWWFTRLDWGNLLQAARIDAVNPPLYYVFVKLLAPSGSEVALRFPSVLAHLSGIAGAAYLGYLLGGRPGAIAAGVVWAAHPMTLWAARDARPYALAAALAVLAVGLFLRLQHAWSRSFAFPTGLVVAFGLLTHYFFFVLVAALLALAAVDLRRAPVFFRRWTALALLAMVPLAIWLAWFFSTGSPSLGIGWIRAPLLGDIPLTLWNLASGFGGIADPLSTLLGLFLVLIVGIGLAGAARGLGLRFALVGLLLPIVGVWLISQRRPVYIDRYFVVVLPFVVALVALGVDSVARRISRGGTRKATWVLAAVAASLVVLSAGLTVHTAQKFTKEDWRGLAEFLKSHVAEADALSLSEPEIALPLSYYFDESFLDGTPSHLLLPACGWTCWAVLRQPYTATHAFTQTVKEAGRASPPLLPDGCDLRESWESPSGVAALWLACDRIFP
ncbi:MAG: 2 protein [Anaerolineales bacterium]|nr:2 protein [Anaerolineales bacterium]